jgi:hypothetical protein
MTLTTVLATIGSLVGTAGFVISLLNYFRDKPKIRVALKWDMSSINSFKYDQNRKWGIVSVSNVGRRPIFISHASLTLPKGHEHTHLLLSDGIEGARLAEGDRPAIFLSNQLGLEQYAEDWKKVRAIVVDSAGKVYMSPKPKRNKPPSWASKG